MKRQLTELEMTLLAHICITQTCPGKRYSMVDSHWRNFCIQQGYIYGFNDEQVRNVVDACTQDKQQCWLKYFNE